MQLLPSLTRDLKKARRETPVGRHLPYARHVDPFTIETRDGLLLQFIKLRGYLFETADTDEINYRKRLRDSMLQAIGSARFALYHHIVRRQVDPGLAGHYSDNFSRMLDDRWRTRLVTRELFVNDLYLTIVRRPAPGRTGLTDHLFRLASRSDTQATIAAEVRQLTSARDAILASLASYAPQPLGLLETPDGHCSEPLEFLSQLLNREQRPVLLPQQDLGHYLPYRRISFGQQAVEIGPIGTSPRQFSALVSIKDYPGHSAPGMLDELLRLPLEMTISQSFGFVERRAALRAMNLALRRMRAADDEALSLRAELGTAKDETAAGRTAFGEHHLTVAVHGEQLDQVDQGVAEVQAALAEMGAIAVREEIALEPAYWAQFPGNAKFIARRALVSTANFAALASGHSFPVGSPDNNHWGEAVALLETTAAGPYYFNFHHGDLGNFTIIGPSGSGKTVVLNFLLSQARKYQPRIAFFDKDRGAEPFIRAIDGSYQILRPGRPSGLNPLQLANTPENRRFLLDWLTVLAGGINGEESNQLIDAIDANFVQASGHRRLRDFAQLLRGSHRPHVGDLWSRIAPWWGNGERAWLFDNDADELDLAVDTIGFDMTLLLDDPVLRTPAMLYLFHRVEERLDGHPTIIVVDEGWKALDDDVFVGRIRDWEKTIRKRNGIVGFATQSAQDAIESRIASAIIEQAATQIFMANPKARAVDYIDGFGLSAHEFELVRTLPDDAYSFLVRHGTDSVIIRLNLTGEKELLTILSGRERTVRLLDEIRMRTGDRPSDWMAELLERA